MSKVTKKIPFKDITSKYDSDFNYENNIGAEDELHNHEESSRAEAVLELWSDDMFCSQCHKYCEKRFGVSDVNIITSPILIGYLQNVSDDHFKSFYDSTSENHDCVTCQIELDEGDGREDHYEQVVFHENCRFFLHDIFDDGVMCDECAFLSLNDNKNDAHVIFSIKFLLRTN